MSTPKPHADAHADADAHAHSNAVPSDLARAVSTYLTRVEPAEKRRRLRGFVEDLAGVVDAAEAGNLPFRSRRVGPTRGLANLAWAFSVARRDLAAQGEPRERGERGERGAREWSTDGMGRSIIDAAATAAGWAAWTEFYQEDEWTRSFVHRFAGGTVAGPTAPWRVDNLVLDVFVYGPDIDYPSHAHPAEEVYLILGGTSWFRTGTETEYHPLRAGDLSHHPPDLPHAIRIGDEPVLGVVMYRGDLDGPLWYRSDMDDETEEKRYPGVIRPE